MKKFNYKLYLLITLVFFSTSVFSTGTKQRPPEKTNVEKSQQLANGTFSWLNQIYIKN